MVSYIPMIHHRKSLYINPGISQNPDSRIPPGWPWPVRFGGFAKVMISSAANLKRLGVSDVSKDLGDFPRLVSRQAAIGKQPEPEFTG